MQKKISKKKSLLLTAAVLAAMSVPVQAAEKKQEATHIKTGEVVVTASRTKQEVKETPSSVEVITREDIDKMGAESVLQALQLAVGLDTLKNGMVGNHVSIRGMKTNHTLLLVDGRRVRTGNTDKTTNVYELERFNIDDVERIEIVRGAASSLYGSEALGGVINIIRKRPGEQKTSVTLDWTSLRKDGGIHFDTGKQGKWNFSTSFKISDYRERDIEASSNLHGKKYFLNIEGRMDVAKDKWLDVFADYLGENLDRKEYSWQDVHYDNVRLSTGVKYAGRDKRGDYEMQVYYTRLHTDQNQRHIPSRKLKDFDDITFRSLIFDGRRSMQLTKAHLLTFGGEYRKEDYEGSRMKGSRFVTREGVRKNFGESSVNYAAFYVQDEWLVHPDWLLIPSVRFDHSSSFGSKVTGNLGTTYKINRGLRFKANVGTAYRAPTSLELYMDWYNPRLWIEGNPNLKPETALNFDLGFELDRDMTFGKITYFHNKVDNLIDTDLLSRTPKWHYRYMNRKKATLQGIEVEARQALGGGFSVRGLYTYLDARDGDDGRLPGRPYHKTSLQISYEDQKNGWDATLWNDWLAGYYLQKKNHSSSIMNLVIHKKINENFSAYFGIDNIFDVEDDIFLHDGRIWRGGVHMEF